MYNRSSVVIDTIESIIRQTYRKWELIVVDDNSTDDSFEKVSHLARRISGISLVRNTRKKGAQGARNTGLLKAKADLIVFFDSDNLMKPTFLEEMVNIFMQSKTDVVTCQSEYFDHHGKKVFRKNRQATGDISQSILNSKVYVDFNSSLVRRSKLIEIGMLDEDCPSFQEWDTHIRLSRNSTYSAVTKKLVEYRIEGDDSISKSNARSVEGYYYILKKHKELFRQDSVIMRDKVYALIHRIMKVPDFQFQFLYFVRVIVLRPQSCITIINHLLRKTRLGSIN